MYSRRSYIYQYLDFSGTIISGIIHKQRHNLTRAWGVTWSEPLAAMIANHHMSNDTIRYNKTQYVYIRCNGTCQSPYEQRWPTINDRVIAKSARVPNCRVPNDAHHGINTGNRRRQRNKCALACATPAQGTFKHTNKQKHNCKCKYK